MNLFKVTNIILILSLVAGVSIVYASEDKTQLKTDTTTKAQNKKFSLEETNFAAGYDFGLNAGLDPKGVQYFIQGLQAAYGIKNDSTIAMTKNEMQTALAQFYQEMVAKNKDQEEKRNQETIKQGEEFMAKFLTKDGAVKDPSGFAYIIKKSGSGSAIKATDDVTLVYVGQFIDGTVFDQSIDKAKPITFNLSRVISGFRDAVTKVKDGGVIEFVLPYNLAYGTTGSGQIKPYQTIVFNVEVLSHKEPKKN